MLLQCCLGPVEADGFISSPSRNDHIRNDYLPLDMLIDGIELKAIRASPCLKAVVDIAYCVHGFHEVPGLLSEYPDIKETCNDSIDVLGAIVALIPVSPPRRQPSAICYAFQFADF